MKYWIEKACLIIPLSIICIPPFLFFFVKYPFNFLIILESNTYRLKSVGFIRLNYLFEVWTKSQPFLIKYEVTCLNIQKIEHIF